MLIWLVGSLAQLSVSSSLLIWSRIVWPILSVYLWYQAYSLINVLVKFFYKLRYQVFNKDLKYTRNDCKQMVLVITGATSGIGLAATKFLHSKGFTVIACYYNKLEPGYRELEEKIEAYEGGANSLYLIELDVTKQQSIVECHQRVIEILDQNKAAGKRFHALINVAGVGFLYKFQWQPRDTLRATLDTNFAGPVMLTREFMPLLVANGKHARLVNVTSPMSVFAAPYSCLYGATKAALVQFTNCLRVDALGHQFKTCLIYPGHFLTSTSILGTSLSKSQEELLATLSEEERRLYAKELERQEKFRAKLEHSSKRPKRSLEVDFRRRNLAQNLARLFIIASGWSSEPDLVDSPLMNSFEQAVRMRDPPMEIFAGNRFFELVTCSCLEVIHRVTLRDISLLLAKRKLFPG